jgi:hypothetical protein
MKSLDFKNALIAFHRLVGSHDGKNMAETVLHVLDRAGITNKVDIVCYSYIGAITEMTVDWTFHFGQCFKQQDHDGRACKTPSRPEYSL